MRRALTALAAAIALFVTSPAPAAAPEKSNAADAKKTTDARKTADAKKTTDARKNADAKKSADVKKTTDAAKDAAKDKAAKRDAAKDGAAGVKKADVKGPASIGAPNRGKLAGAVKLHASRSLKLRDRAHAWGTPDLVKLLQRAAGKVAKRHPKSVLLVGDLSRKAGGALAGHNSHQSGRDADVGFYVANSKGRPAAMTRFVAFDGEGKSEQVKWAQFDDARNWALVEALLTDKEATVRYVFVSNPLRARMLAHAKKKKVAKDLYARAEAALLSPRDADVHDDHFHVRIACPESMKGTCVEESFGPSPAARPKAAPSSDAASGAKAGDAASKSAEAPAPKGDAAPDVSQ